MVISFHLHDSISEESLQKRLEFAWDVIVRILSTSIVRETFDRDCDHKAHVLASQLHFSC